jgi:hypothetical protein
MKKKALKHLVILIEGAGEMATGVAILEALLATYNQ